MTRYRAYKRERHTDIAGRGNNEQEAGQPRLFLRYKVTTGSLSDRTKLAYTYHINEFLAHYRITDLQPLKEYSPKVLKQMVKDYILHLRDDRKLSGSSISLHVAAIAHFFYIERDDDYKIDWKKVRLEIPPNENIRRDRAYTIEEIQKMLSVCSRTRERVVRVDWYACWCDSCHQDKGLVT